MKAYATAEGCSQCSDDGDLVCIERIRLEQGQRFVTALADLNFGRSKIESFAAEINSLGLINFVVMMTIEDHVVAEMVMIHGPDGPEAMPGLPVKRVTLSEGVAV